MSRFWRLLKTARSKEYDFWRLVDAVDSDDYLNNPSSDIHIICDIDKTYLETQFESVIQMARIALESAEEKITVQGASDVLLAARWGGLHGHEPKEKALFPRPLHFVSSSPPQLRRVLEEKLVLDGLDWSSDTFKNQAYNVIKGRVDLLQNHIAYKTAAILRVVKNAGSGARFFMIGDNAESDALIYMGVSLKLAGVLHQQAHFKFLVAAGVDEAVAKDISHAFEELPDSKVEAIFIRNAPGYDFVGHDPFNKYLRLFDHFYELGLLFVSHKVIPFSVLESLTRTFHNRHSFSRNQLSKSLNAFLASNQGVISDVDLEQLNSTLSKLDTGDDLKKTKQINLSPIEHELLHTLDSDQMLEDLGFWFKKLKNSHLKKSRKKR